MKKSRSVSPIPKGQIIGMIVGSLIALAFYYHTTAHPIRYPSPAIILAILVERLPIEIWNGFGLSVNDASGKFKHVFVLLLVGINAVEGLLIGTLIGRMLQKRRENMIDPSGAVKD
jgi:hypothetical protein